MIRLGCVSQSLSMETFGDSYGEIFIAEMPFSQPADSVRADSVAIWTDYSRVNLVLFVWLVLLICCQLL